MRRIFLVIGVAVLLFGSICEAKKRNRSGQKFWGRTSTDDVYIDEDDGPSGDGGLETTVDPTHVDEEGGDDDVHFSGDDKKKNQGGIDDDGDDDDSMEMSGSGMGEPEETVTTKAPIEPTKDKSTAKPLTPCQQLQKTSMGHTQFVPKCNKSGEFERMQCQQHDRLRECWCVNKQGIEINGTRMTGVEPDCIWGENFKPCVFQNMQHDESLLGAYLPKCDAEGYFSPLQCSGSKCFCVNKYGTPNETSYRNIWEARPKCEGDTAKPLRPVKPTEKGKPFKGDQDTKRPDDGYVIPTAETDSSSEEVDNVIVNVDTENKIPIDPEEKEEETNTIDEEVNDNGIHAQQKEYKSVTVLAQPGILAAVIGGAVVGLLCMVLLVMFVVYRVRKKDEGSYPLDDKNYQNYSYAKAPDKEFYA